jgi:hypothetical protein
MLVEPKIVRVALVKDCVTVDQSRVIIVCCGFSSHHSLTRHQQMSTDHHDDHGVQYRRDNEFQAPVGGTRLIGL